ncbi:PREDICTED: F-box/FBD/LRR-repeat protein At3g26920-like [Camelina sativa]|uniref:F-box/FBD/LRR-repeat protein At3g26920-like n=1 Tax=Camelina sativa TaxID=90675 RepID=A0ABM0TF01_CAMSA|nr:PREDICTED: F-box/FBD/LRR-repeat protein At3g26920-like [Camelina sativa]
MKRCKSCGQSLSNEDKISDLPEALLLQILSLLPTKDVVAMTILAKRWRYLWKMVPNLEFDYNGRTTLETFSNNVCRCLLSHQAPVLQSLHISISIEEATSIDIAILLGIAFGLHVRKLVLTVYIEEEPFKFPSSLYNCETLETLEFGASFGSILVDVPSPVCLKSLRTLHLLQVEYKGDESILNLLSGCINLETLVVNRNGHDSVDTFTIASPSLQRLTIIDDTNGSVFEIYVPSLKYLKIEGRLGGGRYLLTENVPELVEADIDIDGAMYENILGSLTSVKRLSLKVSPLEITLPISSTFYHLTYLELCTYKSDWWNLLTFMLDISPNLQVLKLIGFKIQWDKFIDQEPWGKWNKPKNVPECFLLHLETLLWTCYEARLEDEIEVAKYILRNARRLEKATFSKLEICSDKRVEMVQELKSVVRASKSCQLVFK